MRYAQDITACIGNTPLVRIRRAGEVGDNLVLAKLETFNPGASLKDRAALQMIEEAEAAGRLGPGGTIVEATSGNTGIALALIAAAREYRVILVMPESMSIERRKLLGVLGAELELTPAAGGMRGAIDRAEELARQQPNAFLVRQFHNPANARAHAIKTAEEIFADTGGNLDYLVAPVGTGGTLMGCASTLKKHNPNLQVVGVEPQDSQVLAGGQPGPHQIQGIGAPFVPEILDTSVMDSIIAVSNREAFDTALEIGRREGILAGPSSGAALCAVRKIIREGAIRGKTFVTFFFDSAERYLSLERLAP